MFRRTLTDEGTRVKKIKEIEELLSEAKQKLLWVATALIYFLTYTIRAALMLAVSLGAAAALTVAGAWVSLSGSIVYAVVNLVNTITKFWSDYTSPENKQGFWSLLWWNTSNNRSYLAEICGCTSIILSGLITLGFLGIVSFSPVTLFALGIAAMVCAGLYTYFWIRGKLSKKNTDPSPNSTSTAPVSTVSASSIAVQKNAAVLVSSSDNQEKDKLLPKSTEKTNSQDSVSSLVDKNTASSASPTFTTSSPALSDSSDSDVEPLLPKSVTAKAKPQQSCSFCESWSMTFFSKAKLREIKPPPRTTSLASTSDVPVFLGDRAQATSNSKVIKVSSSNNLLTKAAAALKNSKSSGDIASLDQPTILPLSPHFVTA